MKTRETCRRNAARACSASAPAPGLATSAAFACVAPDRAFASDASATRQAAWVPASGVLFGGWAVRSSEPRGLGNTAHAEVENWPQAVSLLEHTLRLAGP